MNYIKRPHQMLKILPLLICCCPCPAGHGLCAAGPCGLCPCPSLPSSRVSDGRVLVWTWPRRECSCHREEQMLSIRASVCMWVLFLGSQLWNIKQPSWLYPGFFWSLQLLPRLHLSPTPSPPSPLLPSPAILCLVFLETVRIGFPCVAEEAPQPQTKK